MIPLFFGWPGFRISLQAQPSYFSNPTHTIHFHSLPLTSSQCLTGWRLYLPDLAVFISSLWFISFSVKSLSHGRLFVTPWAIAYQAPPSMGFSRQEYWSGLLFPSPGDLPDPEIKPGSPMLWADTWPSDPPGKPFHSLEPGKHSQSKSFILLLSASKSSLGIPFPTDTHFNFSNSNLLISSFFCHKIIFDSKFIMLLLIPHRFYRLKSSDPYSLLCHIKTSCPGSFYPFTCFDSNGTLTQIESVYCVVQNLKL